MIIHLSIKKPGKYGRGKGLKDFQSKFKIYPREAKDA
jgi:hypothetical protein